MLQKTGVGYKHFEAIICFSRGEERKQASDNKVSLAQ